MDIVHDGGSNVFLYLHKAYKGEFCGICGNFNGDASDEMVLVTGKKADNFKQFYESWRRPTLTFQMDESFEVKGKNPDAENGDTICKTELTEISNICQSKKLQLYLTVCKTWIQLCRGSSCKGIQCSVASAYAEECREGGVAINWRQKSPICSEFETRPVDVLAEFLH